MKTAQLWQVQGIFTAAVLTKTVSHRCQESTIRGKFLGNIYAVQLSTAVRLARGLLADRVREQREIRERTRQRQQEAAGSQQ